MAKKYVGAVTVRALMEIIKEELDAVNVNVTELLDGAIKSENIVTDLETYLPPAEGEAADNKVVAASVVKELQELISGLTASDGTGAVTGTDILKTWDGYDADADADKVVAAALVKAIKDQVDALATTISTELDGKKGQPGGIASLDDNGKVPADQLPSYVDDVIEGFFSETTEGETVTRVFYEPNEDGTAASTTAITGEKGKIYIDLATSHSYRWTGSTYARVDEVDLVELTAEEVETLWNEVAAEFESTNTEQV